MFECLFQCTLFVWRRVFITKMINHEIIAQTGSCHHAPPCVIICFHSTYLMFLFAEKYLKRFDVSSELRVRVPVLRSGLGRSSYQTQNTEGVSFKFQLMIVRHKPTDNGGTVWLHFQIDLHIKTTKILFQS